ncbi:hypothetical protein [Actinokineospora sp.]|uniref:hypothetical protein n=1 Tax=Actinokineospora sp. TaxID=1872133 RepID=UPI003D6A1333
MSAVGIRGIGAHLPGRRIDNDQIRAWTGATTEWVRERTGIIGRRYAGSGTVTSDLAVAAVADLLATDPAIRERIDLIVLATSTPDQPQPATAAIVQHKLGSPTSPRSTSTRCARASSTRSPRRTDCSRTPTAPVW